MAYGLPAERHRRGPLPSAPCSTDDRAARPLSQEEDHATNRDGGLTLLLVLVTVLEAGARPKIESEEEFVRWVKLVKWITEGGEELMCDFYEHGDLNPF